MNHCTEDATICPKDLEKFYFEKDQSVQIRFNVAKNPNTAKSTLLRIAKEEKTVGIIKGMLYNPSCDNEVINNLLINYTFDNNFDNYVLLTIINAKGHILSDDNCKKMFDLGCYHIKLAPRLDINRLKRWIEIDKSNRESYFKTLIAQKTEELLRLWTE